MDKPHAPIKAQYYKVAIVLLFLALLCIGLWYGLRHQQREIQMVGDDVSKASLARCLHDRGAVLYVFSGETFSQLQEELFGQGAQYLNKVECNTPDEATWMECQRVINDGSLTQSGYPTWELKDGKKIVGSRHLVELASETGCQYTP